MDDVVKWLNEARQEAYVESLSLTENNKVESILRSKMGPTLTKAKEKLIMARKPNMRVVEHYLCDDCDKLIERPEDGYIIQGNIYAANPAERGGIIGNNFPKTINSDEPIKISQIKENVICKTCLIRALKLSVEKQPIGDAIRAEFAKVQGKKSPGLVGLGPQRGTFLAEEPF